MSETGFYELLLDLPNLKVDKVESEGKKLYIYCHILGDIGICPSCKELTSSINQYTDRKVQDLSIVGKEVWLVVRTPQFHCTNCRRHFNRPLDFADPNKSYTRRQSKWIFELCAQQPFTQVGALVNRSHKTVSNLYYEQAERRLNLKERFKRVRHLGIDEISHRKGKRDFCCVLTDLERGIELDILPDRKKETLCAYFKDLGTAFCEQIQVVSCDIWEPYILAARQYFPNADITIDRFHVVKALNQSVDTFRKTLRKEEKDADEFKKLKWILFKQPQNCSPEQQETLQKAFMRSPSLHQTYIQRNRFHDIYHTASSARQMKERLNVWIDQAKKLEQSGLNKFIKTLQNWMDNIASFAKTRVTNAATEGLNNLIRHIKRISFGIPKFEHLRLRVLAISS